MFFWARLAPKCRIALSDEILRSAGPSPLLCIRQELKQTNSSSMGGPYKIQYVWFDIFTFFPKERRLRVLVYIWGSLRATLGNASADIAAVVLRHEGNVHLRRKTLYFRFAKVLLFPKEKRLFFGQPVCDDFFPHVCGESGSRLS